MTRHSPYDTTSIEISFRTHDVAGPCCYVTVIRDEAGGQRHLVDSVHLTGAPERLYDDAMAKVREYAMAHWLVDVAPF
jgi:hypothetical protein